MGVVIQIQRVSLRHEAMKRTLKTWRPLNVGDPCRRCCLFFVQFRSFPYGQFLVGLGGEQNLTVRWIVGIWE